MKNEQNKKTNKPVKNKKTFKELWASPLYNPLIKLGMWGVFFLILYLFIFIGSVVAGSSFENNKAKPAEEKTQEKLNYTTQKTNLLSFKQNIIYHINDYYINGEIQNNVLIATLEDGNDNIYKIKFDSTNLFQIKKEEERINEELLKDINKDYLLPAKIFDIIDNPKLIPLKSAGEDIYTYNIDDVAISVYLGNKSIEKIIILDNDITYELEYKMDQDSLEITSK